MIEELFADHSSSLARARCREEMFRPERENDRVSDLVYGEFGFMALASLFKNHAERLPGGALWRSREALDLASDDSREVTDAWKNDGNDEEEPGSSSIRTSEETRGVFLDLGSGMGRPVFGAAALGARTFHTVIGVEILPGLHELAEELGRLYDAEVKPRLSDGARAAPEVRFVHGDFAAREDALCARAFREADVVLMNSCCFGDDLFRAAERKASEALKRGAVVVTLRRNLADLEAERAGRHKDETLRRVWKVLEATTRRMSWGSCVVYVHVKMR
jgi:SAM-dependent methyltransferase